MTKQDFIKIKKEYVNSLKEYLLDEGGIFPHLTFFGEKIEGNESHPSVINVPLPDEYIQTEEGKDKFIDGVFPQLSKTLNAAFNISGMAWASEAWLRVAKKDEEIKDYTDLPVKEEVLIINIESEFGNDLEIYKIKRKGLQVTQDGEMSDKIQLIKKQGTSSMANTMKGRFAGLYKKLKKEDMND